MRTTMRPFATRAVVAGWLLSVATGVGMLLEHGTTPGAAGSAPAGLDQPLATALHWQPGAPVVVLFAHPQCPCLPSTLAELRRTLAEAPPQQLRFVVFTPGQPVAHWDPEAVLALRRDWPAATLLQDVDGVLAARFGAATSGQVLAYDPTGRLRFAGGLTAGRGHQGQNAASRSFASALRQSDRAAASSAVFGCPLCADTGCDG